MDKNNVNSEPHIYVKGVVDRIENQQAIVKLAGGGEVKLPLAGRQSNRLSAGQAIRLVLQTADDEQKERELLAKTILNEILKPSQP